jgi:CBS domain-containing protein
MEEFMQVKEVMTSEYKFILPDTTLREAAEKMRDCKCGYLPIGEDDRLTGAVTDRDIIVRGIAAGHNPDEVTVKEIMSGRMHYCYEEDDVKDAAERMKNEQIRRLVVLNKDKRIAGILTVGDIARSCNDSHLTGDIESCIARAS